MMAAFWPRGSACVTHCVVAAQSPPPVDSGVIVSGGRVLACADEGDAFYRRAADIVGAFLQIKNLNVLIGAGASYALGSPRIRSVGMDEIHAMLERNGVEASSEATAVVRLIVEREGGTVDLEQVLATLSSALALAGSGGSVELSATSVTVVAVREARGALNRALALDCDLPKADLPESHPLGAHRTFFRRLLRARRLDLPRVRIFTTNYDLAIEKALDADGTVYFDGFSGTVERVFKPEMFERDLYLPPDPDQRRMLRVPDLLYLHKLHGSINWRKRQGTNLVAADEVIQESRASAAGDDELILIFPTPLKEGDVLAYPYSVLFRTFMSALAEPDAALIAIGYGFADDHINRQLLQALGSPSFQLLAIGPSGVFTSCSREREDVEIDYADGPLGVLARAHDARITVISGSTAGRFEDFAVNVMPDSTEAGGDVPLETQAALAESLESA